MEGIKQLDQDATYEQITKIIGMPHRSYTENCVEHEGCSEKFFLYYYFSVSNDSMDLLKSDPKGYLLILKDKKLYDYGEIVKMFYVDITNLRGRTME